MKLVRQEDGQLLVSGISKRCAEALRQLPEWLRGENESASTLRLRVYRDEQDEREWRRHGVPEIEHLFATRSQLLLRDLATLCPAGAGTYRLRIANRHTNAWFSSLNLAAHVLFEQHGLSEADMELDVPRALEDFRKFQAALTIHEITHLIALWIES